MKLATAFVVALAACTLNFETALQAQTGLATLNGQITDPHGRVVPSTAIEAINIDTGVVYPAKTNGVGLYSIASLPPGRYRVHVKRDGFKEVNLTGLDLHTQDVLQQNFALEVGSTSESVSVEANGVNINTTDASVSTVIDRDFVENTPLNGRSLQDLETLAPGTVLVGASQGISASGEITVNGQRTEANSFSVDGVGANIGTYPGDLYGAGVAGGTPAETALGTTQSLISVDALQEFRATTSTYSAEYGRTPGGQFSFTTRSGTNDWHGSAFDYFRNEALDANNWFNNAATPQVPREKERQNDFGGTLGGPFRVPHIYNGKDKTFFFFSYEGLRLWTPQGLQTSSVPNETLRQQAPAPLQAILNAFPLANKGEDGLNDGLGIYQVNQSSPSSIDNPSVRIDHNLNDKFKIFGRYANTPTASSNYYGSEETNLIINNRLLTVGATNAITSKQANELRFNFTQVNSNDSQVSTSRGGATRLDLTVLPGPNGTSFPVVGSSLGVQFGFGGPEPSLNLGIAATSTKQYNVTDTYSWSAGRHRLKFGLDWRWLATYASLTFAGEYAYFPTEAAVLANNVGSTGYILAYESAPAPVEPLYKNFSTFVEDEWNVSRSLSLSMGMRWDVNPAPTNITGPSPYTLNQISDLNTAELAPAGTPLWNTDWHGFAPRIGGAYQLRQSPGRETVLRGGFGLFYDLGSTAGSFGFGGIGFQSSETFSDVSFPLTSAQITLPPPSLAAPYNGTVYAFDRSLKLPFTLQWNVALQQGLGAKQAITVSYVGSAARDLLETYFVYPPANPYLGSEAGGNGAFITQNGPISDYNSLQTQFQRTLSRGLEMLISYTYSHSIDNATTNFGPQVLLERASSDFDIRHNLQAAATYQIQREYLNPIVSALLAHWAVDARISARSALPVDVVGNYNVVSGTSQEVRFHPNLVVGEPLYMYGSQYPGGRIINYDAFSVPTSGPGFDSEGDTPRNYARGFGAWQLNSAIRREFPIHEQIQLQFRAEAFNLFNRPSFSGVDPNLGDGTWSQQYLYGFGGAESTLNVRLGGLDSLYALGGPRSLQLALKLLF